MKSETKRFEKDGRRLVYNITTKVAKIWAEDIVSAREFFIKHMDDKKIGVVKGIAVTLAHAPKVTFIIRGKQLYPFVSSKMNEKDAPTKSYTFNNIVEKQETKITTEEWVELVIYCPDTHRFLFKIYRGKSGFPIALVRNDDPKESAIARLGDLSGSVVTAKHTKPFNEVATDGVKHHFFFMVCKHEFIPNSTTIKWAPHKIEGKNFITELMFEKDPTLKQIVENEKASQKMDFSKLVDDIMD